MEMTVVSKEVENLVSSYLCRFACPVAQNMFTSPLDWFHGHSLLPVNRTVYIVFANRFYYND